MLTDAQARLADQAIARVKQGIAEAERVLSGESTFLVWFTGSEAARAAREESLRQSRKIYDQLLSRRAGLSPSTLQGFLDLARAAALVDDLIVEARRMTVDGFRKEVVDPTLQTVNPLDVQGWLGKRIGLATLAIVAVLILTRD